MVWGILGLLFIDTHFVVNDPPKFNSTSNKLLFNESRQLCNIVFFHQIFRNLCSWTKKLYCIFFLSSFCVCVCVFFFNITVTCKFTLLLICKFLKHNKNLKIKKRESLQYCWYQQYCNHKKFLHVSIQPSFFMSSTVKS